MHPKFWSKKLEGRDHLEDLCVQGVAMKFPELFYCKHTHTLQLIERNDLRSTLLWQLHT